MKIESEVKEEPLFSFKNAFKPTTKNIQIVSLAVRGTCVTLLANAVLIATTNFQLACIVGLIAIIGGFLAELFLLLTREKPIDSLVEAALDVKEEVVEEAKVEECHEGDIK